jgi:NADP-dependent 3-hydroxy acid dehydrogenase YdfG
VDLGLEDKVAVVTGASRGIGHAVTNAPADEGTEVVPGARSTETLDARDDAVPVSVEALEGACEFCSQITEPIDPEMAISPGGTRVLDVDAKPNEERA